MFKREKELMLFNLPPNKSSLEGLFLFLFVYVGASLFASALTGPLYSAILWFDSAIPCRATKWLVGYEIDTYYDRLRWIPIIVGLPWMMKRCGLFSLRNIGLPISAQSAYIFFKCFLAGFCVAAAIFGCQYAFGDVSWRGSAAREVVGVVAASLAGALLVAFLEELVFRCLIMRSIYTAFGAVSAVVLTSLFFAYKHFKVPDHILRESLPGGAHASSWDIGYYVCYYDAIGISMLFNPVIFSCLTVFGAVLAMIYIRTKVLWGPIALHSGIVFAMLSYGKLFVQKETKLSPFLGGGGMTEGYLALGLLSAVLLVLIFGWRKRAK